MQLTPSTRISPFSWVVFVLSIILFAFVLGASPITGVLALISSRGPSLLWAALPFLAVVGLEVAGWKTILGALEQPVSFARLLHVRLAVEAVARVIPGGPIAAEGLKLYLVSAYCAVPPAEAAVSLSVIKVVLMVTHAIYLAVGAAISASRDIKNAGGQTTLLSAAAAAILLALALSAWTLLVRGSVGRALQRLLIRLPSVRLRSWLTARDEEFQSFDNRLRSLASKSKLALWICSALFLMSWFSETLETVVLARLLGAHLSFAELLPLESRVSIIRALAFFIPGALGVQDAGYMAFLQSSGLSNVTSFTGAFVLLKRAKELFWIVTSVFLLMILKSGPLAAQQCRRSSSSAAR